MDLSSRLDAHVATPVIDYRLQSGGGGQVSVTTYYMKNTIEERLLAYRQSLCDTPNWCVTKR
jgi:hypothetical protein